jgi:hypothetical protein
MGHTDKGGQNGEQLLNTTLGMEVDKETIFSLTGFDNSEQLHHPGFI